MVIDMAIAKRALVADDHSLYREGLTLFLKDEFRYCEVGEAATFDEAAIWLDRQPDTELALFDLSMPGVEGPGTLMALHERHPNLKIVIVAASETKRDVLAAIAAGLNGYIPKTLKNDDFFNALKTVLDGHIYVPQLMLAREPALAEAITSALLAERQKTILPSDPILRLTPRQREVLEFIKAGLSNREIAQKLGITVRTVKIHVSVLLLEFNARNRIQLAIGRETGRQ